MRDAIKAFGNISIQHILGFLVDANIDRLNGIMTGTSWSKSITVGFKFRFPFRFQGQLEEHLCCSVEQGWNAQWSLFRRSIGFGNPDASGGENGEINMERLNKIHSLLRWECFHPINSGRFLALIFLGDSTYRQTFCGPGPDQKSLKLVDKLLITTL